MAFSLGGLGKVVGGVAGLLGSNSASGKINEGYNNALSNLTSTYNNSLGNYGSYLNLGNQANNGLSSLLSGDYSGFYNSPDYQSAMQSGTQALDRSAAAKGSLYSGGHSADLTAYGQNLANQYLNSYRNSLMGLSNTGLNAANGVSQLGANYSDDYSNLVLGKASNNAASSMNKYNSIGNIVGGIAGFF